LGFSSGEGLTCLKASLLFLAVVAVQVRHYIKPQALSFLCLPATVATNCAVTGAYKHHSEKPKAECAMEDL